MEAVEVVASSLTAVATASVTTVAMYMVHTKSLCCCYCCCCCIHHPPTTHNAHNNINMLCGHKCRMHSYQMCVLACVCNARARMLLIMCRLWALTKLWTLIPEIVCIAVCVLYAFVPHVCDTIRELAPLASVGCICLIFFLAFFLYARKTWRPQSLCARGCDTFSRLCWTYSTRTRQADVQMDFYSTSANGAQEHLIQNIVVYTQLGWNTVPLRIRVLYYSIRNAPLGHYRAA